MNIKSRFGFTMLEVTGAVALALTLATVSLLSVKGTITAGQRSSALAEIQTLNSAWNNYKNAGGVIAGNDVESALTALKTPLQLAGSSDYLAYNGDPSRTVKVGSDTYDLSYDPATGFSYVSGLGDELGFNSGGASGNGGGGNSGYPFDITDPGAFADAIAAFEALPFGDPARQAYLDAFNAARALGTVPAGDLTAMDSALADSGALKIDGEWVEPPFDYRDPTQLADAMNNIESYRGTAEYEAAIAALNAGKVTSPSLATDLTNNIVDEFRNAVNTGNSSGIDWAPLAGVNFVNGGRPIRGVSMPWTVSPFGPGSPGVFALNNLENPPGSIPAAFNSPTLNYSHWNLSGANLSTYAMTGLNFAAANFSNTILPTNLSGSNFYLTNLSGRDFSGSNLTGANLAAVNLSGTVLPTNLTGVSLVSTDLSNRDLSSSILAGANLSSANLIGTTLPVDISSTDVAFTSLAGQNLRALNLSTTQGLRGVNLVNAVLPLNMSGFSLQGATLNQDLTGYNLPTNLGNINASGVTFPSNWTGYLARAQIVNSTLNNNLSGQVLGDADIIQSNLAGANLQNAVLIRADLGFSVLPTNLQGAVLAYSNLSGRTFNGYNLSGSNLGSAEVTHANFTGARISSTTVAPNNTLPVLNGSGNGTWNGRTVVNFIVQ